MAKYFTGRYLLYWPEIIWPLMKSFMKTWSYATDTWALVKFVNVKGSGESGHGHADASWGLRWQMAREPNKQG